MGITKDDGRQALIAAIETVHLADLGAEQNPLFELPGNAVIVSGFVEVTDLCTTGGASIDVGNTADDDAYTPTALDLTITGRKAITPKGGAFSANDNITLKTNAALSDGTVTVCINYVVLGRTEFTQG